MSKLFLLQSAILISLVLYLHSIGYGFSTRQYWVILVLSVVYGLLNYAEGVLHG